MTSDEAVWLLFLKLSNGMICSIVAVRYFVLRYLILMYIGYYSYLYAKCFAATIWQKMFQDDPLSPATGSAFRRRLLQHGGAKDPAFLLKDLVGDGIIRYRDKGIVPDTTSLYCEMGLLED